jgi:WD40 repeat protein
LYYASGHDVYCLSTATKKRRHIATLPFEARCTASGYGWVCVGGEDEGHFAAIKLDGGPRNNEVDERLDIGGAWASGSSLGGSSTARRGATVKVERIGEEIVNSISIHRIQDEEAHLDDIVAVLTNNDKTVRVYSLPQRLETCVLDLPFAMNHATISPDGTMLVAVGDVNQAYFFQRYIKDAPPQIPKPHNRLTSGSVDWKLTSVVNLHVSAPDSTLGYFTTAWSPNGRLIALGSEGGYITVLDLEILGDCELEDEEAIVAVVPGSRPDIPQPHPGAVRSMLFAPDPWDLLIWAEDQGRVCIGDLRTGLKRKQVVTLDPREEGLPKVEFEDLPQDDLDMSTESVARTLDQLERDFLRRYRDAQARDSNTAVNFATEYIEARRRQRQHRQDLATSRATSGSRAALDDDPRGLTTQEQEILDALRTTRQREEARSHTGVATNVNYTTGDIFGSGTRSSSSGTPNPESGSTRSGIEGWPEAFPELLRMTASPRPDPSGEGGEEHRLAPIQVPGDAASWGASRHNPPTIESRSSADTTTSGSSSTTRTNHNPRLPRRRASVILSPPTTTSTSASASTSASTSSRPTASTREAEASNTAWRTIENALSLTRGPLFEAPSRATPPPAAAAGTTATASTSTATSPSPSAPRIATELAAELAAERARARTLTTQRDRWRALASDGSQPPSGINTYATGANATATISRLAATAAFPDGYEAVHRRMRVGGIAGPSLGVRTAGLAVSGDGSTVWAACEEGIFELKVERKKRMFWPAVEMR